MSGICGILSLNGSTIDPAEIKAIAQSLERRGPDGTHVWRDGPVALGHALLATTPEALTEVLPLTDRQSGCTITADVRLDNREELLAALGMEAETRTIGDGELILRAYLHWGEPCPEHLLGDFAFAIWDPRSNIVFCARDHMGMRQLSYHHAPGQTFIFATEPEAVLEHPLVPKQINEGRIADFLDYMEGIDLTSTFFEDVVRLPPAHCLTVSNRGLSLRRYWELRLGSELKLDSDEAYTRAFLDVYTEAVRCRLRSAGPVGSLLSGGLDSNSVASVAAKLLEQEGRGPLQTFSAAGPDSETCIETRCVHSGISNPGFAASVVSYAALNDYRTDLSELLENSPSPFDCDMTLVRAVYLAAHRQGVRVMLDGVVADVVLAGGNRVAQLIRRGNFRQALIEARAEGSFWGSGGLSREILASAWVAFAPAKARKLRHWLVWQRSDRRAAAGKGRVTRTFAAKIELKRRRAQFRQHLGSARSNEPEYRAVTIRDPHQVAGRERYDRIASSLAIEPRDPFLDIRIVQFCLSLPAAQVKSGGWPKLILRRAMKGFVPDDIAWRRGKDHLGGKFTRQLISESNGWKTRFVELAPLLRGISSEMTLAVESGDRNESGRQMAAREMDSGTFIELFALGCWLARNDVRDSGHSPGE